ncbi:unnamed protein product [Orchesella dallaii]|uniref:Uncharacterized protein n=1 Tax=Orchesella dallaii TaxID=48710 RepID=A0ABP1R252_9HEXA
MGGRKKSAARVEPSKDLKEDPRKRKLVAYTPPPETNSEDPTPDKRIRSERGSKSNYEGPAMTVEEPPLPKRKDSDPVIANYDLYDPEYPIYVDRYGRKETAMSEQLDSLDKMFFDINQKANYYTDSSFQFPFLDPEFWNDFRVVKIGSLFSFKLHYHELYDIWEQCIRKKNAKYSNSTYFYWPAADTRSFVEDSLIPLGKRFRFDTVDQILGDRRHMEDSLEDFFDHPSTVDSPDGAISLRPFTYKENPNVLYVKWFQRSQRPVTLKNKNQEEFIWSGYTMVTNLTDYFMLVSQIKEMDKVYKSVIPTELQETTSQHSTNKRSTEDERKRNKKHAK